MGLGLALIHSPLVGPSSWRRTADALEVRGQPATAVDYGGVSGPDWYGSAAGRIAAALAGDAPAIIALHSGAGGFVPALAERLGARAAGFILVDAVMPYPGQRWLDTAPPALVARLEAIVAEGVLPPWDAWFGAEAIARVLGDPALAAGLAADLPRVPFAYLEAPAPGGEAWREVPAAYLQLSDACAADADAAAALGWPVRREPLHHLAMLTHPDRVADMLCEMARELAAT